MLYLCVTCQVALGTKHLATFCFCVAGLVLFKLCLVWETYWSCRTFSSNAYVLSMAILNLHQSPMIAKIVFTQCCVVTVWALKYLHFTNFRSVLFVMLDQSLLTLKYPNIMCLRSGCLNELILSINGIYGMSPSVFVMCICNLVVRRI